MKEKFSLFRREMDVVQAIGLYSIEHQECLYTDQDLNNFSFAIELCKENLSSSSDFFHLDINDNRFMGHYNGDHLLIFQLDTKKEINIVILELKTRQLLSNLIN